MYIYYIRFWPTLRLSDCICLVAAMGLLRKLAGGLEVAMKMSMGAGKGAGQGPAANGAYVWKKQVGLCVLHLHMCPHL